MRELKPIAHILTDFPTKFGVPRQSGLVKGLRGRIVFEPEYRDPEALRGLERFSHVWLLWDFSEARAANSKQSESKFKATVRPPRLGGNRRMGVWATRSPFRPNNIGLSSVRIVGIELHTPDGPVVEVEGIDMMSGTPIFDIKPYLPFTDCHPDAVGSLSPSSLEEARGEAEAMGAVGAGDGPVVKLSAELEAAFDAEHLEALRQVLASEPQPHYHADPDRVYVLPFAGREVGFRVTDGEVEGFLQEKR